MNKKRNEIKNYTIINRTIKEGFICNEQVMFYEIEFEMNDGIHLYCFSDDISGSYVIKNHSIMESFNEDFSKKIIIEDETIEEIQNINQANKSKYKMLFIETLNFKNDMDELATNLLSRKKKNVA